MSCTSCFNASPIPSCISELIIGAVTGEFESLNVFFLTPSGSHILYEGEISEGIVTVPDVNLPANGIVNIWVNDPASENFSEKVPMTINGTEYTCIEAKVQRLRGVENIIHDISIVE